MTTKEQERKALAQIKKIVDSLGEDSYIATAFEGCFEIAADNIENDFACSMKQRAESAEKKAAAAESAAKELGDRLAATMKTVQINHDNAMSEIRRLEEELAEARKMALDPWLYDRLMEDYGNQAKEHKDRMAELADIIVDHAEQADGPSFRNAVASYRVRKEHYEICDQVVRALEMMQPAGV